MTAPTLNRADHKQTEGGKMKCMTCGLRETEHSETTLCAACDRDEWREATIGANKRFQYAEDQLRRMHREASLFLMNRGHIANYPCNYDELCQRFHGLNQVADAQSTTAPTLNRAGCPAAQDVQALTRAAIAEGEIAEGLCGEVDRLRAQRDTLLAALKLVAKCDEYYELNDGEVVRQWHAEAARSDELDAAMTAVRAAIERATK